MTARFARWSVDHTWDGDPVAVDERATVTLALDADAARIDVDAPYHGDPAPPGEPGSLEGLWEYEVVELFLLGRDEQYVEIELSPHGHHLALAFQRARRRLQTGLPLRVAARRMGSRWRAKAELDPALLPAGLCAANAFAIHGIGPGRRYLVSHPMGGQVPDFHRIGSFPAIDWRDSG